MKHEIVKREIIHSLELTDKELDALREICRFYQEANINTLDLKYHVATEIINLFSVDGKHEDIKKVEEDLAEDDGEVGITTREADELLEENRIFIGQRGLYSSQDSDFEFDVIVGKQDQLGIRVCDGSYVFFNNSCARLIRDFIAKLGAGFYYGYAPHKDEEDITLNVYVDANHHVSTGDKLILKYKYKQKNSPFIIHKDDNILAFNFNQAGVLMEFIKRHY